MSAPSEDSNQPGHPPSLISLHCPIEESLGALLSTERTAKTLIRLGGCPGIRPVWSETSLGAHSFVGFVISRLICIRMILISRCNIDLLFGDGDIVLIFFAGFQLATGKEGRFLYFYRAGNQNNSRVWGGNYYTIFRAVASVNKGHFVPWSFWPTLHNLVPED